MTDLPATRPLGSSIRPMVRKRRHFKLPPPPMAAPVRDSTTASNNPVAWVIIVSWVYFNLVDTLWSGSIPYANPARMLVPVILMGLLIWERKTHAVWLPLDMWVFLIVAMGAISSAAAAVPVLGFLKLAFYVAILVPILFSHSIRTAFAPPASGFFCLGLIAVLMVAGSLAMFPFTQTGFYDNPNKLGMLSVCVWPVLMLLTRRKEDLFRYLGWVGLVGCAAMCILPHSRGGSIGLLTGLTFYTALRISPTVRSLIVSAVLVAAVGWLIYSFQGVFAEYALKNRETILGSREMIWQEVLYAWSYRPLLGFGFGLSWTLMPEDAALVFEAGRMSWFTVEFGNSTLAMLSGGGLVIAVLFYGMIAQVLLTGLRSLRLSGTPVIYREQQLVLVAAILGMLVHAQCEAWLMAPLTWPTFLFWLYISISAELSSRMIPAVTPINLAGFDRPRSG